MLCPHHDSNYHSSDFLPTRGFNLLVSQALRARGRHFLLLLNFFWFSLLQNVDLMGQWFWRIQFGTADQVGSSAMWYPGPGWLQFAIPKDIPQD
jgi:hypothetical protein